MMRYLLVLMMVLLGAGECWGADWYVRPVAECPNNGNGTAYACAGSIGAAGAWNNATTFTNVSWASISCGDTLWVAGAYTGGKLVVAKDCDSSTALKIRLDYPGDPGTINGNGAQTYPIVMSAGNGNIEVHGGTTTNGTVGCITAQNVNDIKIYNHKTVYPCPMGIDIQNVTRVTLNGFDVQGTSIIGGSASVSLNNADDATVSNGTIHDCGTGGVAGSALKIFNGSNNFLVRDVTIHDIVGNGLSSAFNSSDNNGTFEQNTAYNIDGYGFKATGADKVVSTVYFKDNISYSNIHGFFIDEIATAYFYNNTAYNNSSTGFKFDSASGNRDVVMKNNVVQSSPINIDTHSTYTTLTSSYNLFYAYTAASFGQNAGGNKTLGEWQSLGYDTNASTADPLFVNAAAGIFTLRPESPAIDSGVSLAGTVDTDVRGFARPYGRGYDIGAYEWTARIAPDIGAYQSRTYINPSTGIGEYQP